MISLEINRKFKKQLFNCYQSGTYQYRTFEKGEMCLNNNNRDEMLKAAAVIMIMTFTFLPVVIKIISIFLALIYIIFDIVNLKRNGFPGYRIVLEVFLAITIVLMISFILIETKFTALYIYQNYIRIILIILAVIITIIMPLTIRYKEGGWKKFKSGIWIEIGWTILYILTIYQLFSS